MVLFRTEDRGPFQQKVLENYHAGILLLSKKYYNAAASKFYYSFVLLGLRNIAIYGNSISADCYWNPKRDKLDKSKIKTNARGLKIIEYMDFSKGMNRAESARVKADYLPNLLNETDFDEIIPKLKNVLKKEGVLNE